MGHTPSPEPHCDPENEPPAPRSGCFTSQTFRASKGPFGAVNTSDYNALLSSLNNAVAILDRHRTPEPDFIAAYDTLKQSRAMIMKIVTQLQPAPSVVELAAAA